MKERFNIKKEHDKAYRFEVKNEKGHALFNSILFSNKEEAKMIVKELQAFDLGSFVFERKTNYDGKFHFKLKTKDSRILGHSGFFNSQAGLENGIKHMQNHLTTLASSSG